MTPPKKIPDSSFRRVFESRMIDCLRQSEHGYVRAHDAIAYAADDTKLTKIEQKKIALTMINYGQIHSWVQNRTWKSLWRIETAVSEDSAFRRALSDATDLYMQKDVCDALAAPRKKVLDYVQKHISIALSKPEIDACLEILGFGYLRDDDLIIKYLMHDYTPVIHGTIRDKIDLPPPAYDGRVLALPSIPTPIWVRTRFKTTPDAISKFVSEIIDASREAARQNIRNILASGKKSQ